MTTAIFYRDGSVWTGFSVSGHSGYSDEGSDIVCAGISASVQMCVNGITEVMKIPAEVLDEGERIALITDAADAQPFLRALELQLRQIAESYPKYLRVSIQTGRPERRSGRSTH